MAQHAWGPGQVTLRAMFSLEPWTVSGRQYPLLFQEGETAYGKPIVDGQHPHDFVMELAALYDLRLGEETLLTFYATPVGDPAIGPTAYPHRAPAMENPVTPLGHHQDGFNAHCRRCGDGWVHSGDGATGRKRFPRT